MRLTLMSFMVKAHYLRQEYYDKQVCNIKNITFAHLLCYYMLYSLIGIGPTQPKYLSKYYLLENCSNDKL